MSKKFLYLFKEGHDAFGGDQTTMKNILGGKGAGLAEMTHAGMPVPQGFTITTEACTQYYADNREINDEIKADIFKYMGILEEQTGKKFGDIENPLLVSVRSGARQSMPGMMDTILNLGLNDQAVEGLAKKTSNPRFAYDCYRRFIQMYSDVVMELGKSFFEERIDAMKERKGVKQDIELDAEDLKELVKEFKAIYLEKQGEEFPQDPKEQLIGAVKAVFRSWDNPRANVYRKMNEIPYEWGTAVNVQQMAFGNSGMRSGTGVAFTRNPATGEKKLMGEYLINAQGEDVVAGIRTPSPISKLHEEMPEVYDQFVEIATRLENYYKDMQDMEFTIEDGKLFMLQTRNGKRTAQAALQIACDLVDEGVIDQRTAVLRVEPKQLDTLLHPQFDAAALKAAEAIGKGLAASPGSACGRVVFSAEDAEEKVKDEAWKKVVLVRLETSPEDIVGMQVSQGILTVRGGMTSHAAVVARGMGTCCVSGCGNDNDVAIDYDAKVITINGHTFHEGDWMSIDGSTGNIYEGQIATVASTENANFKRFMSWADEARQMKVMTNADNPRDAQNAVDMGAEGIGLCRTEHMFFAEDRIAAVREMICARTVEERKVALAKVEPFQEADFTAMYRIMGDRPMTIRYLDPPLHEFLPTKAEDIEALAKDMGMTTEELNNVVVSLHEFNPMMGHRGCRLAVTYPEIAEMQTNAVIKAAIKVSAETGKMITPHIMVPLVGEVKELKYVKDVIVKTADKLIADAAFKDSTINGMITGIGKALDGVKINDSTNLTALLAQTGIDYSTKTVAKLLTDESYGKTFANAAAVIGSASSWSKVNTSALKWGVKDKDSFFNALAAVMRPFYGVLDVLLNDASLGIFNIVHIPGSNGYSSVVVPLLEAFGCYNIKTQYQYREDISKAYDNILLDIVNSLWDKVEDILNAPLQTLMSMLPNLALFIANDGLLQLIENLFTPVSALLDALKPIVNVNTVLTQVFKAFKVDLNGLLAKVGLKLDLNIDLYDLTAMLKPIIGVDNIVPLLNQVLGMIKIKGKPLGLELMDIDWFQLASHGKVMTDASQAATYGTRVFVKGDASETLIAVLRYLVEVVNYKDNYNTVASLVGSLIGGSDNSSITDVVGTVLNMLKGDTDKVIGELCNLLQQLGG